MIRNIYFCTKETYYAGQHYWPGQAWDNDVPEPPPIGDCWILRPLNEPDTSVDVRQRDSIVTSAAHGSVQWAAQPGRPRAAPPTPEELEREKSDPYGLNRREGKQPTSPKESGRMTPEEIQKSITRQEATRADFERDHAAYAGKDEPPGDAVVEDEPAGAETSFLKD